MTLEYACKDSAPSVSLFFCFTAPDSKQNLTTSHTITVIFNLITILFKLRKSRTIATYENQLLFGYIQFLLLFKIKHDFWGFFKSFPSSSTLGFQSEFSIICSTVQCTWILRDDMSLWNFQRKIMFFWAERHDHLVQKRLSFIWTKMFPDF